MTPLQKVVILLKSHRDIFLYFFFLREDIKLSILPILNFFLLFILFNKSTFIICFSFCNERYNRLFTVLIQWEILLQQYHWFLPMVQIPQFCLLPEAILSLFQLRWQRGRSMEMVKKIIISLKVPGMPRRFSVKRSSCPAVHWQ